MNTLAPRGSSEVRWALQGRSIARTPRHKCHVGYLYLLRNYVFTGLGCSDCLAIKTFRTREAARGAKLLWNLKAIPVKVQVIIRPLNRNSKILPI